VNGNSCNTSAEDTNTTKKRFHWSYPKKVTYWLCQSIFYEIYYSFFFLFTSNITSNYIKNLSWMDNILSVQKLIEKISMLIRNITHLTEEWERKRPPNKMSDCQFFEATESEKSTFAEKWKQSVKSRGQQRFYKRKSLDFLKCRTA